MKSMHLKYHEEPELDLIKHAMNRIQIIESGTNEDIKSSNEIQSVSCDSPATMNKLHIENGIIYTFRDEINAFEVEEYLKDRIYQYKIGTRFIVFCGFHTSSDGQLASSDLNLVDHYQAIFN